MEQKEKIGCQKNNQRLSFTKDFKRTVLIELSLGKKPENIINNALKGRLAIDSSDKKYYSKLIYKWKKEICANRKLLAFTSIKPTNRNLDMEISIIGDDNETSDIGEKIRQNFLKKENIKV